MPGKNDWAVTCRNNLEEIDLKLTFEEIKALSIQRFMTKVSKAVSKYALSYLNQEKLKLRKVLHITHSVLRIENYLLPKSTSIIQAKFTFHARTRMLDVKLNYKNRPHLDLKCPLCRDPESLDSQQHLLLCTSLSDNNLTQLGGPVYSDLFCTEVLKQIVVATFLVERFKLRK